MIKLPSRTRAALDRNTISDLNSAPGQVYDQNTITSVGTAPSATASQPVPAPAPAYSAPAPQPVPAPAPAYSAPASQPVPAPAPAYSAPASQPVPAASVTPAVVCPAPAVMPVPVLMHTIAKGQKISLVPQAGAPEIKCLLGWNVTRADVDIDISAFMLGANGKVPGEDWFVFYSQTNSPDRSVRYEVLNNGTDRQSVSVNLSAVDPSISKIVFVLTINEALEKNLNFSMVKDAYIRIINSTDNQELASYKMTDYYSNVISMMIGEVYRHGTEWKFNAVGNGVARDLAGLCELYGVETV